MRVAIGPWWIDCDPDATGVCYARVPPGYGCDCNACRNLDALGSAAFPSRAQEIFDKLGIDWYKPAEVYHVRRLDNGLQHYGGWYHCVGRIEPSPEKQPPKPSSGPEQLQAEPITEHFTMWCSTQRDLAHGPFRDFPLVQVDFHAELPWVLDEPEPD